MKVLAVDAGGTNLALGIVSDEGELLARESVPVRAPTETAEEYLEQVLVAGEALQERSGIVADAIALAMPGPLDAATGIVFEAPNLGSWRDAPVRDWLQERTGKPVTLLNDAEAAALGEGWKGAGEGARCLVVYTLGTGVGGGLLFDGRIWQGTGGSAGELGHVILDPGGPLCGCGRHGCLEAYAGKAAILSRARALLGARASAVQGTAPELEPRHLAAAAEAGDTVCRGVFTELGRRLGQAMTQIITILAPDRIVITGGVAASYDLFAPAMRQTIEETSFAASRRSLDIRLGTLAGYAGVLGAARAHLLAAQDR